MAPIAFPIERAGLILPVLIGLDGQETAARLAAGQPIPAPVEIRGLVDTATDVTAVAASVLQQLGIPVDHTVTTQTAAGAVTVNVKEVSLSLRGPDPSSGLVWTVPSLLVTELATTLPDADVLVGLDLLLGWEMFWNGPGRQSTFDF
jgi:hypothetical protein